MPFQVLPALSLVHRQLSDASTDLKGILAAKIPKEQERVKNFRKQHGATKVGEVTVDMVRLIFFCLIVCKKIERLRNWTHFSQQFKLDLR